MVVGCGIKLYLPETKEIGSVKVDMKPKPSPESMYSLASSTSAAFLEDARPFAYLLMNIGVETWMSRTSFQSDSPCRHNSQTYQYKFTSLLLTRVTSVSKQERQDPMR